MTDTNYSIQHLAIIMDGNARWAKENGLLKVEGYKHGVEAVKNLIPAVMERNISYLTLYAFSSENWQRPKYEVSLIIDLLNSYLQSEAESLHQAGIRLKVIGRLDGLHNNTKQKIIDTTELTKDNNKMTLCLAFGYGGRLEIIDACQKIIDTKAVVRSISEFRKYLYDPDMPDVDLLIRSGNVLRISNFLLWHSAYAELFFSNKYWPDFDKEELLAALEDYAARKRTFGK